MPKIIVSKEIGVDYGHRLPNHYSACNQLHGHRARVIVEVEGPVIEKKKSSSEGMVLDFKFIKQAMMQSIHEPLDHGFAVYRMDKEGIQVLGKLIPFIEFIRAVNEKVLETEQPPTAEYLAFWAFHQIVRVIRNNGCTLLSVTWYETPTSYAEYRG